MQSILPICDEFVTAVGDSTDGTREAIEKLNSDKIKIIDTVWDDNLRQGGKIFAQQANAALNKIRGRWGFHIQADEIIHENDLERIKETVLIHDTDERVEGILFPFLNFWGGYRYIGISRRWHRYEVRIIRNKGGVRSYQDSQGFRQYSSPDACDQVEKGRKLRVKEINVTIYHYSYTRPPELMQQKADYFHRFWHDDSWLERNLKEDENVYALAAEELKEFLGTHPAIIKSRVAAQDWDIDFSRSGAPLSVKQKLLLRIEKLTGWRIGEYKNYVRI